MHQNIFLGRVPVKKIDSGNLELTNLRTDEMAFIHSLTKIGTDENKAIYSIKSVLINATQNELKCRD